MDKIAVIILSHNSFEDTTKPCLESVIGSKNAHNFTIVVVDNNSTDGTRTYLENLSKTELNLKLIFNGSNLGFAAGNNIGITSIDAEYYILLNSDTLVSNNWIDKIVAFFTVHTDVGLVGPVSNNVANEQLIHIDAKEEEKVIEEGLAWASLCEGDFFYTTMLGFFCVAIKREVIKEVGLLDEAYGLGSVEDDDYCMRVINAGYKLACLEDVFIYHKGSYSFNKVDTEVFKALCIKNTQIFEHKFNAKFHSRYTNGPFIQLIETYLDDNAENYGKLSVKIKNKLAILERFDFADLCSKYSDLNDKLAQNVSLMNSLYDQLDQMTGDLQKSWQEVQDCKHEQALLRDQIHAMHNSLPWKVMTKMKNMLKTLRLFYSK